MMSQKLFWGQGRGQVVGERIGRRQFSEEKDGSGIAKLLPEVSNTPQRRYQGSDSESTCTLLPNFCSPSFTVIVFQRVPSSLIAKHDINNTCQCQLQVGSDQHKPITTSHPSATMIGLTSVIWYKLGNQRSCLLGSIFSLVGWFLEEEDFHPKWGEGMSSLQDENMESHSPRCCKKPELRGEKGKIDR